MKNKACDGNVCFQQPRLVLAMCASQCGTVLYRATHPLFITVPDIHTHTIYFIYPRTPPSSSIRLLAALLGESLHRILRLVLTPTPTNTQIRSFQADARPREPSTPFSGPMVRSLPSPPHPPRSHTRARRLVNLPPPPPPSTTRYPLPPRSLVRGGQTSPHRLVVSHTNTHFM
jgi:hypothetical protein